MRYQQPLDLLPPDEDEASKISKDFANKEMQFLFISKVPKNKKVTKLQAQTRGKKCKSYYSIAKDLQEVKEVAFTYNANDTSSAL